MMLLWTALSEDAREPMQSAQDDAGLDLYTSRRTVIRPGEFVDVPTDVAVALPPDLWAMLTGRSSTLRARGLLVNPGIIDNGYRGPLFAGAFNLGDLPHVVEEGDRIAQLIPIRGQAHEMYLKQVQTLPTSTRGTNGFGSTGA